MYVDRYADKIIPLLYSEKEGVKFRWGPEQEKAFEELEKSFLEQRTLAYPDPKKPFTLIRIQLDLLSQVFRPRRMKMAWKK